MKVNRSINMFDDKHKKGSIFKKAGIFEKIFVKVRV